MSKAVKVLSLSEIGRGCVDEDRKCIVLPQVQRGKVWNAVRVEILWYINYFSMTFTTFKFPII